MKIHEKAHYKQTLGCKKITILNRIFLIFWSKNRLSDKFIRGSGSDSPTVR